MTKKEIKIDDHMISYLEGGNGPIVVLLQGYTGSKENWTDLAAYLTKDYHLIIPDIPGYGESSKIVKSSYDLAHQMPRLEKHDFEKFHVVGHALGGLYDEAYTVRHPQKVLSVGLFSAAGVEPLKKFEEGENQMRLSYPKDWNRFMGIFFFKLPSLPYPIKKLLIKTALDNRKFYEKEAKEIAPDVFSMEKDLTKIQAPAFVLWGKNDKIFDASTTTVFKRLLKNSRIVIIKECGHLPMIEKSEETAKDYLEFIKGIQT